MKDKTIILGITGGFPVFQVPALATALMQTGATVKVVMTEAASRFVTPLTLQSLTRQPVAVGDVFKAREEHGASHVSYGQQADLIIIAPATANTIGRLAAGVADDMLTATVVASQAPVLIAPAMMASMYLNKAVQHNIGVLKDRGFNFVEVHKSGQVVPGAFAPSADIIAAAAKILSPGLDLSGIKAVVTAGPTLEPLDPVNFLANHSSGRMGFALAEAAARGGAEVVLVTGPASLPTPNGVKRVDVVTTEEMYGAVKEHFASADVLVMAAAVTDFTPRYSVQKLKKRDDVLILELDTTIDILASLAETKKPGQITVGFAAESTDLVANAKEKLTSKKLDFIAANDITREDAGFAVDTNEVTILWADGEQEHLPLAPKLEIAEGIWERVLRCRKNLLSSEE